MTIISPTIYIDFRLRGLDQGPGTKDLGPRTWDQGPGAALMHSPQSLRGQIQFEHFCKKITICTTTKVSHCMVQAREDGVLLTLGAQKVRHQPN